MTLSETAQLTKKIMVYAGIAMVIIFALWGGIAYYLSTRKVEIVIPPPTKGFGILPKPALPKTQLTASSLSYDLNTETGSLPPQAVPGAALKEGEIPDRMNVYPIIKGGVTFSSPEKARRTASAFLFKNGPEILSPTIYKFTDDKGGEFIYSLDTENFRFKRPVASRSAEFQDRETTTIEEENLLVNNFKKYLSDQGALPGQLAGGRAATFYNRQRILEATEAAVTLWQMDIEQGSKEKPLYYPIVTPEYKEGLVRGTVTRWQAPENKYLAVDFIYWQVDTEKFETYPIKTVEQAYNQLQSGEGVTVLPYSKSSVAIEKVYLAYLLPKEYVPFLQPVFVFEGPEFAAYVPAITPDNFEP